MGHLPDISFLSFGKPKSIWRPILQVYEQRLAKATRFNHLILREKGEGPDAVQQNATRLLAPQCADAVVIVFDERGNALTSQAFANLLVSVRPRRAAVVVGTSYGLSDEFLAGADHLVSLGKMTLPHEIARAIALEQLYRAETILAGHPYHHD